MRVIHAAKRGKWQVSMSKSICIQMVEELRSKYEKTGRAWDELKTNLDIARGGPGRVDRSMDSELMRDVEQKQKNFHAANSRRDPHVLIVKADFYRAIGIWNIWCAAQHASCGALESCRECCGFAIGYFVLAENLQKGGEEDIGFGEAYIEQQEFIVKYAGKND